MSTQRNKKNHLGLAVETPTSPMNSYSNSSSCLASPNPNPSIINIGNTSLFIKVGRYHSDNLIVEGNDPSLVNDSQLQWYSCRDGSNHYSHICHGRSFIVTTDDLIHKLRLAFTPVHVNENIQSAVAITNTINKSDNATSPRRISVLETIAVDIPKIALDPIVISAVDVSLGLGECEFILQSFDKKTGEIDTKSKWSIQCNQDRIKIMKNGKTKVKSNYSSDINISFGSSNPAELTIYLGSSSSSSIFSSSHGNNFISISSSPSSSSSSSSSTSVSSPSFSSDNIISDCDEDFHFIAATTLYRDIIKLTINSFCERKIGPTIQKSVRFVQHRKFSRSRSFTSKSSFTPLIPSSHLSVSYSQPAPVEGLVSIGGNLNINNFSNSNLNLNLSDSITSIIQDVTQQQQQQPDTPKLKRKEINHEHLKDIHQLFKDENDSENKKPECNQTSSSKYKAAKKEENKNACDWNSSSMNELLNDIELVWSSHSDSLSNRSRSTSRNSSSQDFRGFKDNFEEEDEKELYKSGSLLTHTPSSEFSPITLQSLPSCISPETETVLTIHSHGSSSNGNNTSQGNSYLKIHGSGGFLPQCSSGGNNNNCEYDHGEGYGRFSKFMKTMMSWHSASNVNSSRGKHDVAELESSSSSDIIMITKRRNSTNSLLTTKSIQSSNGNTIYVVIMASRGRSFSLSKINQINLQCH